MYALLFLAWSEIIVGGQPTTPQKIAEAQQVLDSASRRAVALAVGEFETIRPADSMTRPLLMVPADEAICQTIEVPANQPFSCWLRKRGESEPRLHVFPPAKSAWVVVVGVGQGQTSLLVVTSGENQGQPVLLERIAINVGPRPPPGPTPAPDPPQPPPLPGQGLRVVIVYESSERLSPEQNVILTSRIVRERVASLNGKIRVLDRDTDVSRDEPFVIEAMRMQRGNLPWIIISNGATVFSGPLPATVSDTLKLIEKYKG